MPGEMRAETQAVEERASAQRSIMPGAGSGNVGKLIGRIADNQNHPPVLCAHRAARLHVKWQHSSPGPQSPPQSPARIVAVGSASDFSLMPAVIITREATSQSSVVASAHVGAPREATRG
jgi:hypothetical protein